MERAVIYVRYLREQMSDLPAFSAAGHWCVRVLKGMSHREIAATPETRSEDETVKTRLNRTAKMQRWLKPVATKILLVGKQIRPMDKGCAGTCG